jgi:Spy/CpxP family protein refolding chaperone
MNLRNTLTGIGLVLVFSVSQIVSAHTLAPVSRGLVTQRPQGAGPQPGPQTGAQNRDDLNLTAEQKAQLKSINQSERDQLRALRSDQTLTPDQRKAKAQSIRQASRQQALGILTPQQQQAVGNNRHRRDAGDGGDERGARRRGPEGGRGPGGPRGNDLLNLSDEQKSQFKSIHENARSQIESVRNDSSLTPEQKQAKVRSIHQNTQQQVAGILTPEQREKMHEGRRGPGRRGGEGRPGGLFAPRGDRP